MRHVAFWPAAPDPVRAALRTLLTAALARGDVRLAAALFAQLRELAGERRA